MQDKSDRSVGAKIFVTVSIEPPDISTSLIGRQRKNYAAANIGKLSYFICWESFLFAPVRICATFFACKRKTQRSRRLTQGIHDADSCEVLGITCALQPNWNS